MNGIQKSNAVAPTHPANKSAVFRALNPASKGIGHLNRSSPQTSRPSRDAQQDRLL